MSDKFKIGSVIAGTYKVLDFIGEGAMGLVYKVEHTVLNRTLAFKVLKTEFLSESAWKRFRLEAQAIARLDHANIVKIYDMSQTEDGLPFFTMDLLVGQSLDDYLQDHGPLSIEEALPIFRQVCAGLAYANDRGIIHRDIKPGNIMLLTNLDGSILNCTVKIVDFGIAKMIDDGTNSLQGLTKPGEVFGSPLYMSPEQCMGSKLDQRSDMYSVGITMFQALTGKPPLLGKSAVETAALHQSKEAPLLCDVAPDRDFPVALEDVIATMLEKAPDNRYSSLAEVAKELLRIERGDLSQNPRPNGDSLFGNDGDDNDIPDQDSTEGRKASKRKNAPKQQIAVATVVLLALSATAIYMWPAAKPAKVHVIFDGTNPLSKDDKSSENDLLNIKQNQAVQAFRDSHKGPYSQIKIINKKPHRVFEFPTAFNLGKLGSSSGTESHYATGIVEVPFNRQIKLAASAEVESHPEMLLNFRPDELDWLAINGINPRLEQFVPSVVHLSGLRSLEIRDCILNSTDVKTLGQLKGLTGLYLGQTNLTGKDWAKCDLLGHLTVLQIECVKEPAALIELLTRQNHLHILDIRYTKLSKQDITAISRMSKLITLTLKQCDLDNDDIQALSALANVRTFNFDCNNRITEDCITSLAKFPSLEGINLPKHLSNTDAISKIKKAAPRIMAIQTEKKGIGQEYNQ